MSTAIRLIASQNPVALSMRRLKAILLVALQRPSAARSKASLHIMALLGSEGLADPVCILLDYLVLSLAGPLNCA